MAFKGEIKRTALASQDDAKSFYRGLNDKISEFGDLYVEVHYQTAMQPDGRALFSALLIGRARHDD
jgi:hypothetical protein